MQRLLVAFSILTCMVSGWMFTMYFVLRHPGYLEQAGMAAVIFIGAAAVAAGAWRGPALVRGASAAWAAGLVALGLWALFGDSGDDGWVLVAGVLFVVEGAIALTTIVGDRRRPIVSGGTA
jgi:hypothetical protein